MTEYGVQPTGFVRKPLPVIKTEMEVRNQTEFGSDVIQTPQSPLGQINGLLSDYAAKLWELAELVYQSYDPDQATGRRLEMLGRIRLLDRASGEIDSSYRQAITNAGAARIDIQDLTRAIAALDGVTYAHVFINDSELTDDNGQPSGSLAIAVSGGDDGEIARAARAFTAPGVILHGNTSVSSVIDGYCRNTRIIRPIMIPVDLTLYVRVFNDKMNCPPPSLATIAQSVKDEMYLLNGDDINHYRLRTVIENLFTNVELVTYNAEREDLPNTNGIPVEMGFFERAFIDDVSVVAVTD